jgi:hypothetical protein
MCGHDGLAAGTDVHGRGGDATAQGVVQGLMEALDDADDCGHGSLL